MNFPVWDVAFGSGLLIAVISIVHVFVSHFAVGGGLYLVMTERKAYKENDNALLDWLKKHTKFFVLATVVFGAITGVGIWFTIGLVNPSATSTLIHSYVWGWAIEWVFFFLEITAALMYYYGWEKLDRKTHLWFGWIYFINAFLSMVIINGIITFMLTSGTWVETHEFWEGFFNPTYWPSLFIRFSFSLTLAGLYALLTATGIKNSEFKTKAVKWSIMWIIPSMIVLPLFAYWYAGNIPDAVFESAKGLMPTATRYADVISITAIITFVLAGIGYFTAKKLNLALAIVMLAFAFLTMWSFEFVRESIRKPYIISDYMYANSIYENSFQGDNGFSIDNLTEAGALKTARWVKETEVTEVNKLSAGRDVFRVLCQSCHTVNAYRGVAGYISQRDWNQSDVYGMLGSLHLMRNGVMPPFAGTDAEREAVAAFLIDAIPSKSETGITVTGEFVYNKYCGMCHQYNSEEGPFAVFGDLEKDEAVEFLSDLPGIYDEMPDVRIPEEDKEILAEWLPKQFNENN